MDDISTQGKRLYTPEEDAILQQHYPTHTARQIHQKFLPHRSIGSIQSRGDHLNIAKERITYEQQIQGQLQVKYSFTPEEDAIIQGNWLTHTAKQIQEQFLPHRSIGSIQQRAGKTLGFKKKVVKESVITEQRAGAQQLQTKRHFTPEEDNILREMYPLHTVKEIGKVLPYRSRASITARVGLLRIEKAPALPPQEMIIDEMPLIEENRLKYKKCSECQKIKRVAHFSREKNTPDGFYPLCRLCRNTKRRSVTSIPKSPQVLEEGYKQCGTCKTIKPVDSFSRKRSRQKDGYNSVCKDCDKARKAKNYSYEVSMFRRIKSCYGLTSDDYLQMLEEQSGVCACCGQSETSRDNGRVRRLAVDHCHTTGAIRGLLCQNCNQALGHMGEDPERVKALLKYIEERCLW